MPDTPQEPKQQTRPKGRDKRTGKPAEPLKIPVPKRDEVEAVLARSVRSKLADK